MGKIAKWKEFSEEEFAQMVKESTSIQNLAEKCGYVKTGGGTAITLKNAIEERGLDISHFTGQGWNKDNFDYSRFTYGKVMKSANAKDALVALRGHKCENCGLTQWLGDDIPLEVHHLDGDHLNNEMSNLKLLCPNCHAKTENYRGKNISSQSKKKKEPVSEEQFVQALKENSSVRQALLSLGLSGAGGNYARAYDLINQYNIQHLIKK